MQESTESYILSGESGLERLEPRPDIRDDDIECNANQVFESFDEMKLKPELLRGVYAYGLERPSAIQKLALSASVYGRDIIVQDPTIHKTATFAIPVLQMIDANNNSTQALILVPVRELAEEISRVIASFANGMNITYHICVGGTNVREEKTKLLEGVQLIVGTPGRVKDMINRHVLPTKDIKMFCIDEADKMLASDFDEQACEIHKLLPAEKQTLLSTLTMSPETLNSTTKFFRDPVRITLKRNEVMLQGITQFHKVVPVKNSDEKKLDIVCELYNVVRSQNPAAITIIFCGGHRKVSWLSKKLRSRKLGPASVMHGKMDKMEREAILKNMGSPLNSPLIVATDIPAFGLNQIKYLLVINFDLPGEPEGYVHRFPRMGSSLLKGVIVNLPTSKDLPALRGIEQLFDTTIDEVPSEVDVGGLLRSP